MRRAEEGGKGRKSGEKEGSGGHGVVVVNIYEALLRMAKITASQSAESVWAVFHAII